MSEQVILVNSNDKEIGKEEKMKAHRKGLLHRAFSVFVFNKKGELLLQRRALTKYHTPGLWANTCCSHQRLGEQTIDAGHRRLQEEMGFDCDLKEVYSFIYKVEFEPNLWEHEYDHVLIGGYEGEINPNPDEVEEFKWISVNDLEIDVKENSDKYTPWFKIILKQYLFKNNTEDK